MSSLIEQAAERLEQLRRAGIDIPGVEAAAPTPAPPVAAAPKAEPAPQSRRIELDLEAIGAAGILVPTAARTRLSDQYRVVKRPLIANATGRGAAPVANGNLIMITSAVAGEGKSFTSVNLAMSIAAELDHTVMLVDADVARPSLPRMLGLPASKGLLDVLSGKVDISQALMRTNVEKLTLLTAGSPQAHATELLASDAMTSLLQEMATRYPDRIIIFDSPPLLLTTEARVLATHMGQIVVVVRADSTLQTSVQQALATIEACPVKLMLLNRAREDAVGAYGSSYAYGYDQGYGNAATTRSPAEAAGKG